MKQPTIQAKLAAMRSQFG